LPTLAKFNFFTSSKKVWKKFVVWSELKKFFHPKIFGHGELGRQVEKFSTSKISRKPEIQKKSWLL